MTQLKKIVDWDTYSRELGMRIYRARERAGMTQERVAMAAGISTFTYQKLENGESNPGTPANPKLRTLINLSEALGVSIMDLLPPQ